MRDGTKDLLAFWGLALVILLAIGYAMDTFGNYGILILLFIAPLASRVNRWHEDSRYYRRWYEDLARREQTANKEKAEKPTTELNPE